MEFNQHMLIKIIDGTVLVIAASVTVPEQEFDLKWDDLENHFRKDMHRNNELHKLGDEELRHPSAGLLVIYVSCKSQHALGVLSCWETVLFQYVLEWLQLE